jgi:hypothetical protein
MCQFQVATLSRTEASTVHNFVKFNMKSMLALDVIRLFSWTGRQRKHKIGEFAIMAALLEAAFSQFPEISRASVEGTLQSYFLRLGAKKKSKAIN